MVNDSTGLRIAVTGPESTGKSTLCKSLAEAYNTEYIPEYARSYLEEYGGNYSPEDILRFYEQQLQQELGVKIPNNKPLFIDTEFLNASIWYHSMTGEQHPWIEDMLSKHRYDLYLLMKPDIPWEPDPLRENPCRSEYYFNQFLKLMEELDFNFSIISGSGEKRLAMAIKAVDELINKKFPDTK